MAATFSACPLLSLPVTLTLLSLRHFTRLSPPGNYSLSLLPHPSLSTLSHYPFCYSLLLSTTLSPCYPHPSLYAQPLLLSLRSETIAALSTPATTVASRHTDI
ncbi:hypothetical protein AMTRI_Chr04g184530 [Amborella trichopoda]